MCPLKYVSSICLYCFLQWTSALSESGEKYAQIRHIYKWKQQFWTNLLVLEDNMV